MKRHTLTSLASSLVVALAMGCAPEVPEDPTDDESSSTDEDEVKAPGCAKNARIFTYDPVGWTRLAEAFARNPSPCADYYIHLPAVAGKKLQPRGGTAVTGIHDLGESFHAVAEFHWTTWSQQSSNLTWYEKGVEFRRRMKAAGYVEGRDTWAIEEVPSTVRSDKTVRAHVRDLVRGLYDGPANAPDMGGLVYMVGMGSPTTNFSVYKPLLEDWLSDGAFWDQMNLHVRWWGQEVYPDPKDFCVSGAKVADRAEHLADYMMHPAILASAGPASAASARRFFDESYTPIASGAFRSDAYNTMTISLDNMKAFTTTEVFAARTFANRNTTPDWRIGLAWNEHPEGVTDANVRGLADRMAAAVKTAYTNDGSTVTDICGPSGAYTLCHCNMTGGAFNDGWSTFDTW